MNGNIYKVIPNITKEEILEVCEFREIPDFGDVMTYEDFIRDVEDYCITDYDGCGDLILYDKVVTYASTWIHNRCIYFVDKLIVPFDTLHSIFGNDMKIIWFNK